MDWQIKPLAHASAASGQTLEVGETVICILYLDEQAEIQRVDIREAEVEQFPRPESILGRWRRVVKDRGEENRAVREQQIASAEGLFFSLFDDAEVGEAVKAEREALKQVLALLLERKRVLRAIGRPQGGLQAYRHPKADRELSVPMHELAPEQLMALQGKLEMLVL